MSSDKEDKQMRISLDKLAHEEGEWLDAPTDPKTILRSAIFESLFSYIEITTEETSSILEAEITPERIISAMLKRTELDVLDALLRSYNNRFDTE
tara:strand:+ start:1209 stop:1493 length:285 start_codon:yes stop_codon:yes gene_type:complete